MFGLCFDLIMYANNLPGTNESSLGAESWGKYLTMQQHCYPFLGTDIVLSTTKFFRVYKVDLLCFGKRIWQLAFLVHVCTAKPNRKIVTMVDLLSTRFCAHCIANRH